MQQILKIKEKYRSRQTENGKKYAIGDPRLHMQWHTGFSRVRRGLWEAEKHRTLTQQIRQEPRMLCSCPSGCALLQPQVTFAHHQLTTAGACQGVMHQMSPTYPSYPLLLSLRLTCTVCGSSGICTSLLTLFSLLSKP